MTTSRRFLADCEVRNVEAEDRTFEISFSSEFDKGERWFGIEVLSHAPGHVRMGRLQAGAAVLVNHDPDKHVGTTSNPKIVERKGRVETRFASDAVSEQTRLQVSERVKKDVSVGYIVHHMTESGRRSDGSEYTRAVPVDQFRQLQRSFEEQGRCDRALFLRELDKAAGAVDRAAGQVPTFTVDDWEPYEVSYVAVPFDPTVGLDRAFAPAGAINALPEKTMSDLQTPAPAATTQPDIRVIETAARTAERDRAASIRAAGQAHKLPELAETAVAAGTSVEEFHRNLLAKLVERGALQPVTSPPEIGLSDKERRQYSVVRLMHALLEPNDREAQRLAGLEIEASVAARKLQPVADNAEHAAHRHAGYRIPHDIMASPLANDQRSANEALQLIARAMARRDLNVGTTTAGGHLVATDLLASSFIDLLRARLKLAGLGATVLDGLVGNLAIPSQTAGASTYWVTEGNAVTESEAAFGQVALTPKTVGMFTDYTRRALLQTTPAIEALVRADLSAGLAVEIDRAGIAGSASGGQPRGIINTAGIGAVAGGTNGAAPTYAHMVALEEAVALANADVGTMAVLTNAKMRAQLRLTQVFASTNGVPVWGSDNTVMGYRAEVSNNVPSTLTKGSASGVCSGIIFGNFSDLLFGLWSGVDLILDPFALATSGGRRIVALQDVDVAVRRAASFAAMLDALRT